MLLAPLVNRQNVTILSEAAKRLPVQIMMKIASLIFRCIIIFWLWLIRLEIRRQVRFILGLFWIIPAK